MTYSSCTPEILMLSSENDLRQQLNTIANQSQSVALIHGRLQQIESEMDGFREDILELRATIQRQAGLVAAQQAMIHELLVSAKVH